MDNEPTTRTLVEDALAGIEGVKHLDIKSTSIVTITVPDYPAKCTVRGAIRKFREQWDDQGTIFNVITLPEK